jgi:hypothetical protein
MIQKGVNLMRKELNTSISTYEQIIAGNVMYVDKTDYLYKLINVTKGQFFLSRPRRFGKSMTLSALRAIFQGKKESFKDQYIYDKPYDWKSYPIIHISMNKLRSKTVEEYEYNLCNALDIIAKQYSIELKNEISSNKFEELILALKTDDTGVVILIDEYDKPILDNILDLEKCTKIRSILKSFYGQIKANEEYIRFTFITGVSKFTQVSIFSDMNNLDDITMDRKFAGICGFTQEECEHYFAEWIAENADELEMTKTAYLAKLKDMYNGIRFTSKKLYLYNPVSFTSAMKNCELDNYWIETGTPAFLIELMKKDKFNFENIEGIRLFKEDFSAYEINYLSIEALLFQTGYMTIKDYDAEEKLFTLDYPNREVRESFIKAISKYYSKESKARVSVVFNKLYTSLLENNLENFIQALKVYYANIDYDIQHKDEQCYQLIFYLVFRNLSFRVKTEVKTNKGRMDAVIETPERIYIFEFKLDKSAEIAMDQIKDREYYQKYLLHEKELILVGVNFDSKTGNVENWVSS